MYPELHCLTDLQTDRQRKPHFLNQHQLGNSIHHTRNTCTLNLHLRVDIPSNTVRSRYHPHHRSSFGPFFTSPCPPTPSGLRPKADHELLHVADPALNPLHDGAEAAHVGAENTARSFRSCNHMPHFSNPIFSMSSIHSQWRGGRTRFILMMDTEKYHTVLASNMHICTIFTS